MVDETEKGWYITWIDRDPEAIARQEASSKKEKLAKDDQEKMAEFIKKQVELDRQRKGNVEEDQPNYTALIRTDAEEKIQLGLKLSSAPTTNVSNSTNFLKSGNVFKSSASNNKKYESNEKNSSNGSGKEKRKATSAMEEIMQAELSQKKQHQSSIPKADKPWLAKKIMVKIIAKSLGDKYYKQKGYIRELVDPYTGVVVTNSGAKLKLDQSHLETVIPAKGRTVIILRGKRKGYDGILKDIRVEEFKADIEISDGEILTLPYEDFSKKYQE